MIVFENPGEIDIDALTTFGVSVKGTDHPIGKFGTGFKYAIAVLLREGCAVKIESGSRVYYFELYKREIRGKDFSIVYLREDSYPNDKSVCSLGFTTELGKNWKLWMAYRELYCNAKDEDGWVYSTGPEGLHNMPDGMMGTRVLVHGDAFEEVHKLQHEFILTGEPFARLEGANVYRREGKSVFYRGIKVGEHDGGKIGQFTYDLTGDVRLTEDRTLAHSWMIPVYLSKAILTADDTNTIGEILTARHDSYEHRFRYADHVEAPSDAFLGAVSKLVAGKVEQINDSAVTVMKREARKKIAGLGADILVDGRGDSRLIRALRICRKAGFAIDAEIVVASQLEENDGIIAEDGRIYIPSPLPDMTDADYAERLVEAWEQIDHPDWNDKQRADHYLTRLIRRGAEEIKDFETKLAGGPNER